MIVASLVIGQLAATPVGAVGSMPQPGATIEEAGVFLGARLRLPLGGNREERQLHAGLAMAPTLHGRASDGESRLRIGEGLELGVAVREPLRLSLAGQDVRRLGAGQQEEEDDGVPTWAIVTGAALVTAGLALWGLTEWARSRSE